MYRYLSVFFLVAVAACQSPAPQPAQKAAPVANDAPRRLCALDQVSQAFVCDMEFEHIAGKSCADGGQGGMAGEIPMDAQHEFLERMTTVSLSSLYLDQGRGALPPFRYNSPGEVYDRIVVQECRAAGQGCLCRLSYSDPELLQIFYDSAGCRRSSALAEHPLYFRGRGCY